MSDILDPQAMSEALDDASDSGQFFFTPRQLYYAYLRRQGDEAVIRAAPYAAVVWLIAIGAIFFIDDKLAKLFIALFAGGVHFLLWSAFKFVLRPVSEEAFQETFVQCDALPEYRSKILDVRSLEDRATAYPIPWDEAYERVMFVEDDILVDFFVYNGFTTENKTLVLGVSGYPETCREQLAKILDRDDSEPVYLLHHADKRAKELRRRLDKLPVVARSGRAVFPLGMTRSDMKASRIPAAWRRAGSIHAWPPGELLSELSKVIARGHSLESFRDHREYMVANRE